jgi:LPS-assembly protein
MRFLLTLILTLLPMLASAQGAATLVADSVIVPAGGEQLIAQGNVEVFFDGTRLSAQRITFDQATDRLTIEGPLFVTGSDGMIFTADSASLDPQLKNGILRGARLVLNEQLQLGASQIDRVDGRYTQLYRVAATSCQVCETGKTPLWEIRARRVIHDQDERQLYFDDASFRVIGVPIFWLPRMRLPDPTLTRATGFLIPELVSSTTLGSGVKIPYFIRLGDHRDLTLTPFVSTSTVTLEAAYRQAFARGDITIDAAFTNDENSSGVRAYVNSKGVFDLGRDITLRFGIEYTTDDTYLQEYDYSSKYLLDSEVILERVRVYDRELTEASLTFTGTLHSGESAAKFYPPLADLSWERRVTPNWGGTLSFTSDLQTHFREDSTDIVGRDVARIGFGSAWRNDHVTQYGLVVDGTLGFDFDYYSVSDDSTVGNALRSTLYGQTTLRYPLIRQTARATHVIEPMVQLAWSDVNGDTVTNEDSTSTEFDQANLLALSRFAGEDAVETGLRGAAGLSWTRVGSNGWDSTMTLGRVFREASDLNFTQTSGLRGASSDWLIAGQLRIPTGFSVDSRLLVDDTFDVTRSETLLGWSAGKLDLSAGYIFLPADTDESRDTGVSEWALDTSYYFNSTWTAGFDARYDAATSSPTRAGLQIGWQNECVKVDFSVSRRFTTSITLTPSTDFGLSIGLNGFSAGRSTGLPSRQCAN